VALFLNDKDGVDEIIKRADSAMYRAKEAGGNTICYFD
jgi:GGDEF domain-containing protein